MSLFKSKLFRGVCLSAIICFTASNASADVIRQGVTQFLQPNEIFPGSGADLRAGDNFQVLGQENPPAPVGSIEVNGGSVINLNRGFTDDDLGSPFFVSGRKPGGSGITTVTGAGSAINLNADGSSASAQAGREGFGSINLLNGGSLNIIDNAGTEGSGNDFGESTIIGRNGGTGTLNIDNGNYLMDSTAGAFFSAGRSGGNGQVLVTNGGLMLVKDRSSNTNDGANITLGHSGGQTFDIESPFSSIGTMAVTNGGFAFVQSEGASARLFVGREDDTQGVLNVSGTNTSLSIVGVESNTGDAGVQIGRDNGSVGSVTVGAFGRLGIDSTDGFLGIAREAGSTGSLLVEDGGLVVVQGNSSDLLVGAAFADFGRDAGGNGSLTITGSNGNVASRVIVDDKVFVGAPEQFGGGIGSGNLIVENGGILQAGTVLIGTGGTLSGDGGTILGNVVLDGGTIAPGASPGTLNIDGDFDIRSGILNFEFGGTGDGEFDVLNITGDMLVDPLTQIVLSFIDGFAPVEDTVFDFLQVDGGISDDPGAVGGISVLSSLSLVVEGLDGGEFEFIDNGSGGFGLDTVTAGASTTTPVPVPTALPLMASVVAGFGFAAWRRKHSNS